MKYYCHYPGCNYVTESRRNIHDHHIIPKSQHGKNDRSNRVYLCPTHHQYIYIPTETQGHHSHCVEGSIILLGWKTTTKGRVLLYTYPLKEKEIDCIDFIRGEKIDVILEKM